MRAIRIWYDGKQYHNEFIMIDGPETTLVWEIRSYLIISHEIMVDWIEKATHPVYNYT